MKKLTKMRILAFALYAVGFTFQYTLPVVIFGTILPLTKEDVGKGLTTVGVLALLFICIVITRRLKKRVHEWKRGLARALVLVAFKIVPILLITLFMRWLEPLVLSIIQYWYRMLVLFAVGWVFDVMAEITEASANE